MSGFAKFPQFPASKDYPVRHGSEEAQQDLLRIKLRDSLVRVRVGLINSVRFTLKSLGYAMATDSPD
jgi:hypothetical protein